MAQKETSVGRLRVALLAFVAITIFAAAPPTDSLGSSCTLHDRAGFLLPCGGVGNLRMFRAHTIFMSLITSQVVRSLKIPFGNRSANSINCTFVAKWIGPLEMFSLLTDRIPGSVRVGTEVRIKG